MGPPEISGAECKAVRKRLKLTQQEFADKLGVCRSLIIRGEQGTPSTLLSQVVCGLVFELENEDLKTRLRSMAEQNEATARALKGGEHELVEEIQRLCKENEDLRTAIRVMMAVRKQAQVTR